MGSTNMEVIHMSSGSHPDDPNEENDFKKHPLMNTLVLNRIFEFSSLDTIKNCRMVCQTWNSVVEPILRKRVKIVFNPKNSLGPSSFCDIYRYSEYLPFTSFTMTRKYPKGMVSECNEFFAVYGKNVKSLAFERVHFQLDTESGTQTDFDHNYDSSDEERDEFDITPWILNTPHLTNLKIDGVFGNQIQASLDKLTSIKFLHLDNCTFLLDFENEDLKKISADEITLDNVTFKQKGKFPNEICLNDYFDFRNVSKLYLENENIDVEQVLKLDMSVQVFKINSFHSGIQLDNWKEAKGSVKCLSLNNGQFSESNGLEISQLSCEKTDVDFTVLPESLKKLKLSAITRLDRSENRLVNLPNLNYLCFEIEDHFSLDNVRFFKDCHNLVAVELNNLRSYMLSNRSIQLNLSWLPRNLKKLKVNDDIEFIGEEVDIIEVDTLILNNHLTRLLTNGVKIISKIKPRILVATCWETHELDTTNIIRFVVENTQLEKIVVGPQPRSGYGMHRNTPFETSLMSYFVDKKANYYEFDKQHGIHLSVEVFEEWFNLDGLDTLFEDLMP